MTAIKIFLMNWPFEGWFLINGLILGGIIGGIGFGGLGVLFTIRGR